MDAELGGVWTLGFEHDIRLTVFGREERGVGHWRRRHTGFCFKNASCFCFFVLFRVCFPCLVLKSTWYTSDWLL
jgi:hypothetical protein